MMPASTRGVGMALGFPDVCNTPVGPATAPLPYPNVADHSSATNTVVNVRINMLDSLNQLSTMSMTSGDEAGSAHPTVKGTQAYTLGMPNVRFNMMPSITLASLTNHNKMNCPIGAVIVPSAPNVRINFAGDDVADVTLGATVAASEREGGCGCGREGEGESDHGGVSLRIEAFSLAAATDLAEAVHRAVAQGATRLTLDLRGARGGVLSAALDAAGLFVPVGTPLAVIADEDGDEETVCARGGAWLELPLTVLVDERTASAAEAFADALTHAGRATRVGPATRGKRAIHETVALHDGRTALRRAGAVRAPSR